MDANAEILQTIQQAVTDLKKRVRAAAQKAGRNPKDIRIIAVTKTHPPEFVVAAVRAGLSDIGENKVQEAKDKFSILPPDIIYRRHLIGHLQTNKVRQSVELFDLIHSVDSLRLAQEIDKRCYTTDRVMPILIQVNTSREKSKYGIEPDDTLTLVKQAAELKNVRIKGLMTIGALTASMAQDSEKVRGYFKRLRDLQQMIIDAAIPNVEMDVLSMGMTHDFETAIEEGATLLRIGTAIFGKRQRKAFKLSPKPEEPK
jgi:hypothetical protein